MVTSFFIILKFINLPTSFPKYLLRIYVYDVDIVYSNINTVYKNSKVLL
jgi:hypothetical protein